jgi:putative DNA primase/helicase
VGRIIYALGNGRGKSRANVLRLARRVAQWRTVLLSNGEKTIEAHQAEGRATARAGQSVRLLDLPIAGRYGQFDDLHGHPSGRHLADGIKTACARTYGTAGRAYLEHLAAPGRPDFGAMLAAMADRFDAADGQEARAARQLALIGLAGEVATGAGITGWTPGTATAAARDGFATWRQHRGLGNAEPRRILAMVRDFIDRHGDRRFSPLTLAAGPVVRDRAGWTETDAGGNTAYLFTPGGLRPPGMTCIACWRHYRPPAG